MQRVTNCILIDGKQVLLLQKPSRGWWVAPGGKMEPGESIKEAVTREYREETGIHLKNPQLQGVFSMVIIDQGKIIDDWMMFTFKASTYEGERLAFSPEGTLAWKNRNDIHSLPMAEGDHLIFKHILSSDDLIYGTFHYTPDFQLVSYRLDPNS
ncbi:8-oxo-dGTP diphosphatase [Halalkalibacterium ligniniphilum]|uniref:8-oxo-dGTP diphosphatase n=1 Tax=Halalkalibacterium ligniniphilum TaxID=1134413 RepID=UPI0003492DFB|nr:8-oxo-dGTP diphosphatase [Halalkalibacterium ligniniphilum]